MTEKHKFLVSDHDKGGAWSKFRFEQLLIEDDQSHNIKMDYGGQISNKNYEDNVSKQSGNRLTHFYLKNIVTNNCMIRISLVRAKQVFTCNRYVY